MTKQTIDDKTNDSMTKQSPLVRPLSSGIFGIMLLLPASYFMLTIIARLCFGATDQYYFIAPSFLQTPFHLFAFHKAQLIIGSLVLAIAFNLPLKQEQQRHWLNTAIAFQGTLLLLTLFFYTIIQHLR